MIGKLFGDWAKELLDFNLTKFTISNSKVDPKKSMF
jgi:hypothetical protein